MFLPCINKSDDDDDDEISQKTSVISICLTVGDIQFKVSKRGEEKCAHHTQDDKPSAVYPLAIAVEFLWPDSWFGSNKEWPGDLFIYPAVGSWY